MVEHLKCILAHPFLVKTAWKSFRNYGKSLVACVGLVIPKNFFRKLTSCFNDFVEFIIIKSAWANDWVKSCFCGQQIWDT